MTRALNALSLSLNCSQDDWEEEDSEPEAAKPAAVLPPRKKKSVKQKIAEKEEEERLRRESGLNVRSLDPTESSTLERYADKILRLVDSV